MRSDKVDLIAQTYSTDSIGQAIPTNTRTSVMAFIKPVSEREFFQAGQNRIKPELVFEVWSREYSGEQIVEYNNTLYSVYRRYQNEDGRTELYCQKDAGI